MCGRAMLPCLQRGPTPHSSSAAGRRQSGLEPCTLAGQGCCCRHTCMYIPTTSQLEHDSDRKQEPRSSSKADSRIRRSLALPASLEHNSTKYEYCTSPPSEAAHAQACTTCTVLSAAAVYAMEMVSPCEETAYLDAYLVLSRRRTREPSRFVLTARTKFIFRMRIAVSAEAGKQAGRHGDF